MVVAVAAPEAPPAGALAALDAAAADVAAAGAAAACVADVVKPRPTYWQMCLCAREEARRTGCQVRLHTDTCILRLDERNMRAQLPLS